ncbi:MAG: DUF3443 family protein [Limnohabitans sp.]|nr:DUF3443 family protein [Limnohabitans sp.]
MKRNHWLFNVITVFIFLLNACGGGGGSSPNVQQFSLNEISVGPNELSVIVENWDGNPSYPNQPFTSVTVCIPNTSTCEIVDHVLIDTGSYGLRIFSSAISTAFPQVQVNGQPLAECTPFVSGFTWGSVNSVDVVLGKQVAPSVPIQIISPNYATIPTACSSSGSAIDQVSKLGANGILGVGAFAHDCGSLCTTTTNNSYYYICNGTSCVNSQASFSQQVINPIAKLPSHNNGLVFQLPLVDPLGAANLSGKMILGINTASNNQISTESIFKLNSFAEFFTVYKGASIRSYMDTGSNGIFFRDTINQCTGPVEFTGFYCPSKTLNLTATIRSYLGVSKTIDFSVMSPLSMSYPVQPALAGKSTSSFIWGLPFFYGRKIFIAIEGMGAPGAPYFAF